MRREAKVLIATSFALLAASCAPQAQAPKRKVDLDAEIRRATEHYADLVRKMDNAAIADLFTEDGQMVSGGQTVQGPKAIREHLEKFKEYHVESETMAVQSVHGNSTAAHVLGHYDQTVQLPAGNVVEAAGGFSADWVRGADDVWRLRRLQAFPEKPKASDASQAGGSK